MDTHPLNELTSDSRVRSVILVVLILLGAFLALLIADHVNGFGTVQGVQNTITVTGTGKASAPPTIATIYFTVEQNASTVAAAQDAATKQTNTALAAVKKLGVDDKDVQANGYNVNPQYATQACAAGTYCPPNTGKITGYTVSQSITVKVRDTGKAGDVLQALGNAGVQNISGPNFTIDDDSAVQAEARGKAIADAKQKAEVLAKQLGVRLGKVTSFSESGSPMPYFAKAASFGVGGAGDASTPPTLPTGENETTSTVSITYEIR